MSEIIPPHYSLSLTLKISSCLVNFHNLLFGRFAYVFFVADPSASHSCMISLIEFNIAFFGQKVICKIAIWFFMLHSIWKMFLSRQVTLHSNIKRTLGLKFLLILFNLLYMVKKDKSIILHLHQRGKPCRGF